MVRCPQDLLTFNCLLFSVMHLKRNMGKVSEMWIIELERLSQQFKLLGHQWCFQTFTTCCKATTFSCLLARVSAGEPSLLKTNWQTGICLHSFYSKACLSVGLCALFAFFQWDHVCLHDGLAWADGLCGGCLSLSWGNWSTGTRSA